MNLLLLLLAMCSALTGVGAVVRAPMPAAAAVSVAQHAAAVRRIAAQRPQQDRPPLARVAMHLAAAAFVLPALTPLFASRRRE